MSRDELVYNTVYNQLELKPILKSKSSLVSHLDLLLIDHILGIYSSKD